MADKRFTVVYNEQCKMVQYVDNQKEEPNRWAIGNASETAQKLNELHEENQLLKQRLAEQNDVEWLRNNTVWTTMPTSRRTYTTTSVSDKEKEQKMFLVDMEKQRKMFR